MSQHLFHNLNPKINPTIEDRKDLFDSLKDDGYQSVDWDAINDNRYGEFNLPNRLYQNQERYDRDRRTQRGLFEDRFRLHGTACEYFSTLFYGGDFFQENRQIKIDRVFNVMALFDDIKNISRKYNDLGIYYDDQQIKCKIGFRFFRVMSRKILDNPKLNQHLVCDGFDLAEKDPDVDGIDPLVGDFIRCKIGNGRFLFEVIDVWAPISNLQGLPYWELTLKPYIQDMNTVIKNPDTGEWETVNLAPQFPSANDPSQGPDGAGAGDGSQGGLDVVIDGDGSAVPGRWNGIRLYEDRNPREINNRGRLQPVPFENSGGNEMNFREKGGWWVEDSRTRQPQPRLPLSQGGPRPPADSAKYDPTENNWWDE